MLNDINRAAILYVQPHFLCCIVDKASSMYGAGAGKRHAIQLVLKDQHPDDGSPSHFAATTGTYDQLINEATVQLPALHERPGAEKMAV